MRYFLPAFLLAALDHVDIAETILAFLHPARATYMGPDKVKVYFDDLTVEERRAVRGFLEYIRDTHTHFREDAEAALTSYWHDLGGIEPKGEGP